MWKTFSRPAAAILAGVPNGPALPGGPHAARLKLLGDGLERTGARPLDLGNN